VGSEGKAELQALKDMGADEVTIAQWQNDTVDSLTEMGADNKTIKEYFGITDPDVEPVKATFNANFKKNQKREETEGAPKDAEQGVPLNQEMIKQKEADSFLEAIEAGFDMSVAGLLMDAPDVVLPKDAPTYMRIASQISTLAGDIPAMIAGSIAGRVAGGVTGGGLGAAAPVPGGAVAGALFGSAVGAGAGAFALPAAMRTHMMYNYEHQHDRSWSEFWERTSVTFIEASKAGAIGAATLGAGGLVTKGVAKTAAPVLVKSAATLSTEVGTMVTLGAALEGRVPEPHEFLDAALVIGAIKGSIKAGTKLENKLRNIYAKTGVTPDLVVKAMKSDPKLHQELVSGSERLPEGIKAIAKEHGFEAFPDAHAPKIPVATPLKPKAKIEHTPEVKAILSKIGEKGKRPFKFPDLNKTYTNLVNRLHPIHQAMKELTKLAKNGQDFLVAHKNAYMQSRMAIDAKAKAKHFFEKGTFSFNSFKNNGKGLLEILDSVENLEVLEVYMISKRVIEKSKQGFKTGFEVVAAKKVVAQNKAKYDKAAKEVTEFSNRVLDYVVESGIVSKEAAVRMKALNKDYVSFKRIIEVSEEVGAKKPGGKAGSLKAFKGDERSIQSPVTSIIENTIQLIEMAESNRPLTSLIELAKAAEGQELIKRVKAPAVPTKVGKGQLKKALKESGMSTELSEIVSEKAGDLITFNRQQKDLTATQFHVYEHGKRNVYETTPELAKAIKTLGGDATSHGTTFKLARGLTQFKKHTITFTPDFVARNFIRDLVTAGVFSKGGAINPFEVLGSMGDLMKKNDVYWDWMKSGGANGAFIEMGNKYISKDIRKLQNETNFMSSAKNVAAKPVEFLRIAAELSEQSIRLTEFKKVSKGKTDPAALMAGGFASREVTLDFQRVGAKLSALNSITAFLNVSIQGLDKTARAFKDSPKASTTKALTYITAPSVLLWWANKDDQRYIDLPNWEKDLFWIIINDDWQDASMEEAGGLAKHMVRNVGGKIQINKGHIWRVPKPMELGVVFGSLPERALNQFFTDNPAAFKGFTETIENLIVPNFVPDVGAPVAEQVFNRSFFTERDIIPQHLEGVVSELQHNHYTSDTAKTVGKLISGLSEGMETSKLSSPLIIDNYIRSWGGALGQYTLQILDTSLRKAGVTPDIVKPTATLSDTPFIKAFAVRYPRGGSQPVQDFYDLHEQNKKTVKSIKLAAKRGDFESTMRLQKLGMSRGKVMQLDGIKKGLSAQSTAIQKILKNPTYTADDKRQQIDDLLLQMTTAARLGTKLMRDFRKQMELKEK